MVGNNSRYGASVNAMNQSDIGIRENYGDIFIHTNKQSCIQGCGNFLTKNHVTSIQLNKKQPWIQNDGNYMTENNHNPKRSREAAFEGTYSLAGCQALHYVGDFTEIGVGSQPAYLHEMTGSQSFHYIDERIEAQVDCVQPPSLDTPSNVDQYLEYDFKKSIINSNFPQEPYITNYDNLSVDTSQHDLGDQDIIDDLAEIEASITPLGDTPEQAIYDVPKNVSSALPSSFTLKENVAEDVDAVALKENSLSPARKRKDKRKLHEIKEPFGDKKLERKRQDAIRAKRNRERQKNAIQSLEDKLARFKKIRDTLEAEVNQLQKKESVLEMTIKNYNATQSKCPENKCLSESPENVNSLKLSHQLPFRNN